jgi:predicted dehydrogenase
MTLDRVQAVVISSPHHLHVEHACAALEQGLHVLCEKPMALSASDARRVLALLEKRKLHFVIPYGWNYTAFASQAKRLVQGGEIGVIQHVHLHMASALRELFSGEGAWFAEAAFQKPVSETWSDPARGGGFGHGQLTHALALLFWIADLDPAQVFAFLGASKTGADLFQAISCRFKNGATGMLGGAATMPPGSTYQVDLRLFGSDGILLLDIERPRLEVRRNDGRHISIPMNTAAGEYKCIEPLRAFVDLVQGKPVENRSSAALGVRTVEFLDAAFRSACTGKVEEV